MIAMIGLVALCFSSFYYLKEYRFLEYNVKEVKQGILVFKDTIKLMKNKYFSTDGIRGTVNQGNITGEKFFKFGLASGTYFKNQKSKQVAIIAKTQDFQDMPWTSTSIRISLWHARIP